MAKAQKKPKTAAKSSAAHKDLFAEAAGKRPNAKQPRGYSAQDIEVLEGLEPVRRRPGMYIGGTDERAMHHLVAEVLDNSMDEAVAGHASVIDLELAEGNLVTVRDNGRGIPVDPHPKFKTKSALEVILTMLHSGGKFGGKAYSTSGGLHGVGVSVVNALSDKFEVEVARDGKIWQQKYAKGAPKSKLQQTGTARNRRGTAVTFHPDPEIFGTEAKFSPERLYQIARSKAYLFSGVEIRWKCAPALLGRKSDVPAEASFHFAGGLKDYLQSELHGRGTITPAPFADSVEADGGAKVEWAMWWPADGEGFLRSYCNTVPTPEGGTHEAGLRAALTRGLKRYGELTNNRKANAVTADDIIEGTAGLLSIFIREPQFQGQTKEKLASVDATKLVEQVVGDHFDHWLSADREAADALLESVIDRAEERLRRRQDREQQRKSATRKLRLPGKLTDCSASSAAGTELFLVEGDSAGGSAKQGRDRNTQAILPLRGKILNVASASAEKLRENQEIADLLLALGCGTGANFSEEKLRYERIIIMTDADVDGAHIASLLMTFFYKEMPKLIETGHLFLAQPPLYRLSRGPKNFYARDDKHKDELMKSEFSGSGKVDVSRFKGLGEMLPAQLRETTMDPRNRILLQVTVPLAAAEAERRLAMRTATLVENLMGKKPEKRFAFIQENAKFVRDLDV